MKRAVFPGSFDPVTIGHQDIVNRGLKIFDEIIIGLGENTDNLNMYISLFKFTNKSLSNKFIIATKCNLRYNYIDDIGKDMVLDVLYQGEKIFPGQKIPMNSELDLILGNGKR